MVIRRPQVFLKIKRVKRLYNNFAYREGGLLPVNHNAQKTSRRYNMYFRTGFLKVLQ